jgi:hypothetical protein
VLSVISIFAARRFLKRRPIRVKDRPFLNQRTRKP